MKIWQKGTGYHFRNSDVCDGEAFVADDSPIDIAPIKISGRYPEKGFLYNERSYETAYVVEGTGSIETYEGKTQLSPGDAVHFAPNERTAWDGDMLIVIACSPQFDKTQHRIEE